MNNPSAFEGYVAWLDVLGFKELCAQGRLGTFFPEHIRSLVEARETPAGVNSAVAEWYFYNDLHYDVFQDTVVVCRTCKGASGDAGGLRGILEGCSHLFHFFLKMGVAVRGAVTYGCIERYDAPAAETAIEGRIVNGPAVLEAYEWEQKQEWVGIVLCPNLLKKDECEIPRWLQTPYTQLMNSGSQGIHAELPILPWLVAHAHLPIKEQRCRCGRKGCDGYAIVPTRVTDASRNDVLETLKQSCAFLERMKCAAREDSRHYYDPTLAWMKALPAQLPQDAH